jgi:hypothetical protein
MSRHKKTPASERDVDVAIGSLRSELRKATVELHDLSRLLSLALGQSQMQRNASPGRHTRHTGHSGRQFVS